MFDMFDIDKDGYISIEDLHHVFDALDVGIEANAGLMDMITAGDLNGDGLLSKAEFVEYMREVSKHALDEKGEGKRKEDAKKEKLRSSSKREMMLKRLNGELTQQETQS